VIDGLLPTTIVFSGDMSDPSNAQRCHSLSPSPPAPFQNTQSSVSTNFPVPAIHYSTLTPPHGHGGVYAGQYTMSPQPSPMGAVHSPPYTFPSSHTYHHPDSSLNLHAHYQFRSQHPHAGPVYQYQPHSPLHSSFSSTRPTPMYPAHRVNALGPLTSPHPTPPSAQNSPLSPSYIGSGLFHSLQYPSPMSTPHYTYSPPFPGTPTYQSQYPPSQFSQRYPANRGGEPQHDWYYVPRCSPGAPPQQYDAGLSYSGHYPIPYPQIRPELPYNAHSFSSASSSTPQPNPPFSQHSETITSNAVVHAASQSSDSEHLSEKPIIRQPYHPNPPPHRSEWVMWAGNIPSDATHDEIYRFFSQVPDDQAFEPTASMGVVSVFPISRTNCAFINFESKEGLLEAISRFNGVPLRADDQRCARLVCRVRHKDDDLKAGVGGQRGMGMHTQWVKEQKQKNQEKTKNDQSDFSEFDRGSTSPSSISEQLDRGTSNFSLSSDNSELEQNIHANHSSTSDSYSSSNSSFLARHFPKRYFILKSLTQVSIGLPAFLRLFVYSFGSLSMIWILAFKRGSGRLRNIMKGSWIRLTGRVKTSILSLG
jgi:RNA recognition motif. (a.k.a. RRM, RBD, or RNP domain)